MPPIKLIEDLSTTNSMLSRPHVLLTLHRLGCDQPPTLVDFFGGAGDAFITRPVQGNLKVTQNKSVPDSLHHKNIGVIMQGK
jgi:hypothetical protein